MLIIKMNEYERMLRWCQTKTTTTWQIITKRKLTLWCCIHPIMAAISIEFNQIKSNQIESQLNKTNQTSLLIIIESVTRRQWYHNLDCDIDIGKNHDSLVAIRHGWWWIPCKRLQTNPVAGVVVEKIGLSAGKSGRSDYVISSESVELSCHYEMEDKIEGILQVVWSKDGSNVSRFNLICCC